MPDVILLGSIRHKDRTVLQRVTAQYVQATVLPDMAHGLVIPQRVAIYRAGQLYTTVFDLSGLPTNEEIPAFSLDITMQEDKVYVSRFTQLSNSCTFQFFDKYDVN